MTDQLSIRWPKRYEPRASPVHVCNELDMAAPRERVWAWLVRAVLWPSWYSNAGGVRILEGAGPDLKLGTVFRWKTFGVAITSKVVEYAPIERIAWDGRALGIEVYHAWALQPTSGGCLVLTEETQHGWLARLGKMAMPNRMHAWHQLWLERLEEKARTGSPPPA